MFEKRIIGTLVCLTVLLGFSTVAVRGADILFISSMQDEHIPGDDALKAFMEGLGHTVTYFDDNEDEATTEAAAIEADLVFISESVSSGQVREEITEIETPMVITECWAWDEMGLTKGGGAGQDIVTTEIEIVEPGHPLAAGLSGMVSVLTDITGDLGTARFANGIAGDEATVIATATLTDGQTYDVIIVYEKGAALAVPPSDGSGSIAADIRVCLGFDYRSYPIWNENAYSLLEAAINYALNLKPLSKASIPKPNNNAVNVPQDAFLSWKAGAYAHKHDVYLGTVFNDVNEASRTSPMGVLMSENQDLAAYDPPNLLDFAQTYYWRVDEINDLDPNSPWKGDVWSFMVIDHIVLDDFESYTDDDAVGGAIWQHWIDGFGIPDNGAQAGYLLPPYAEQTNVHTGKQSMPFFYDNDMKYSEAVRTLVSEGDWTKEGVQELSLWFKGHPAYMGSFVEDPVNTFTMTASGADIWGTSDEFHFAFKELTGAGTIITKVESVENTHEFAKAGVMIRDSLDPDSVYAGLFITPENGVRFQFRSTTGATTERFFVEGITAPYWVKLERTIGGLVRAHYSADGSTWTILNLTSVTMYTPMYIGLALTSHDATLTCEATFSNVSFPNTNVDLQWTDQDIGMLSNEAEPMYVVLDGNAVVYHDNPDAPQIDTWTEWRIPLQEFADKGIDLTNIDSIAIGFGDRDNPQQPGGTGTVYFDDIRLYRPAPDPQP